MATFNELIKSGKIRQAYLQRLATTEEISQKILSIKALDQENPNSGTFNKLETNANKEQVVVEWVRPWMATMIAVVGGSIPPHGTPTTWRPGDPHIHE